MITLNKSSVVKELIPVEWGGYEDELGDLHYAYKGWALLIYRRGEKDIVWAKLPEDYHLNYIYNPRAGIGDRRQRVLPFKELTLV